MPPEPERKYDEGDAKDEHDAVLPLRPPQLDERAKEVALALSSMPQLGDRGATTGDRVTEVGV